MPVVSTGSSDSIRKWREDLESQDAKILELETKLKAALRVIEIKKTKISELRKTIDLAYSFIRETESSMRRFGEGHQMT